MEPGDSISGCFEWTSRLSERYYLGEGKRIYLRYSYSISHEYYNHMGIFSIRVWRTFLNHEHGGHQWRDLKHFFAVCPNRQIQQWLRKLTQEKEFSQPPPITMSNHFSAGELILLTSYQRQRMGIDGLLLRWIIA
jgi:hypothetical protein